MIQIIFLVLSLVVSVYSACVSDGVGTSFSGEYCSNGNSTCVGGSCTSQCSALIAECENGIYNYNGKLYVNGIVTFTSGCDYTSDKSCYKPSVGCSFKTKCDLSDLDSLNCARNPSLPNCPQSLDTLCVNIPLSISAQLGTSARAYYVKNEDGSLSKILNDGNADRLCSKSIEQGMGETKVINNLVGPDGENYGTFCQGSCESAGMSNGGQISCNSFGCHESHEQGGSINPNNYGSSSGDFGAGTGGGFGSGGGSGGGSGSGLIGDSIPPMDTTSSAPSWSDGCMVLNLQTCTCDGFTYVGSSGNTATVYNNKTGQTGVCGIDFNPEVASCPVDWTSCNFKKSPNDTTSYNVDSMRVDSSGDWEYNYFPILSEINASIKALDFNQNSNAKDMQNFFNNYKGTNFEGSSKSDTTIINITNRDTTIVDFPDTTINLDFIYDSIAKWNSNINDLKDTLSSFPFFSPDSLSNIEIDTAGSVGRIISTATTLIDSGKVAFPLNLQSFSGQSDCPEFMTQGREIKTFVGSSHSFNYSSVCDVRIFGKPLFALIRTALRLLISISCAWAIFKASVNFRGNNDSSI